MATKSTYDVIIVGAGISGINAAYRLQEGHPSKSYTILEAREALGGTWDLFKYPGIRSDSDLHTFGYSWRPWDKDRTIADGASILGYLKESAAQFGIDKKIQYGRKVLEANWDSKSELWTLSCTGPLVQVVTEPSKVGDSYVCHFTCGWLIFATGYYDYDRAMSAPIPGIDRFRGQVVHPQFWPENLDYKDKDVVIIGSGATAVTLLPKMAQEAAHVTMLQRSPTYILSQPEYDETAKKIRKVFPKSVALKLIRWKWLLMSFLFFHFCRKFPKASRKMIQKEAARQLPQGFPIDPHLTPAYGPWEQRLCACPDGDFYAAIKSRTASIVTSRIKTVTELEILLEDSLEVLRPDIIVTATGLRIQLAGGVRITIDHQPFTIGSKYAWRGTLAQDLPNAGSLIGYTNASWTLGADASMTLITRIMSFMDSHGKTVVVPTVGDGSMKDSPLLNMNSTYIRQAKDILPRAGDRGPWKTRSDYMFDVWRARFGSVTQGLRYH